jgi:Holliday junction resolvasome RuvABC endonuclease subunit
MIVAGIDYSLSSPAICVHEGDEWNYDNCSFHYLVQKEKKLSALSPFFPTLYPSYESDVERFNNLALWSLNILKSSRVERVFMEGYAFGAVGRVFQIAENAGLLKYKVWKEGIPFEVYPPTIIKKFATTKGNSNKEKMYEAFVEENSVDIRDKIGILNKNQWNPVSDIVDSYYIAKLGFSREIENVDQT